MKPTVNLAFRVAALLCLIAITVLSFTGDPPDPVAGSDKADHLLAYAVLSLFVTLGFSHARSRPIAWIALALACVAYGGLVELVQPSFGRFAEWKDLLADAIGSILGAGFAVFGMTTVRRRRSAERRI